MKIAVEGCCHGELDKIYDTVTQLETLNGFKIDVLIICGDFQAVRNLDDLQAMAVPPKYQKLNTFYKYYSGEKVAPVLTIFIGGNHEASNYLQELPYGGWVARNIYYLGYAGIVQVGGVRIGGISGIYKGQDFNKGHYEQPPYNESSKRSVYHVRNLEVFRLKQVTRPLDIFVSHDWPTGIYHYGDVSALLKTKPFFRKEVEDSSLGSKPCADLLTHLQPSYWFAAHLHVKFAAFVQHASDPDEEKITKFLALDKCLPRRKFLQVLDVPHNDEEGLKIKLDPEWLRILQTTDHLLSTTQQIRYMPGPGGNERCDFTVSDDDMDRIHHLFGGDMSLPENFVATAPPFSGNPHQIKRQRPNPLFVRVNPQTTLLCTMLEITDLNAKLLGKSSEELLEESDIGLPQKDDDDVDVNDQDDNDTTIDKSNTTFNPSFFDSSLDVSPSSSFSSNISASWDGLVPGDQRINESISETQPPQSHAKNIKVDDDDEELLSILSAQKSKSFSCTSSHSENKSSSSSLSSTALLLSTPLSRAATASSPYPVSSSPSTPKQKLQKLTVADRLKALNAKENLFCQSTNSDGRSIDTVSTTTSTASSSDTSTSRLTDTSVDTCHVPSSANPLNRSDTLECQGVETQSALEAMCSSSSDRSDCNINKQETDSPSSSFSNSSTYSSHRNTFSSSGFSFVSSTSPVINQVSPHLKRDVRDHNFSTGSPDEGVSSLSSGGSMKKLKRRNVSMYHESVE